MYKENDYLGLNITPKCQDKFCELLYFSCVKIVITRHFYPNIV